MHLMQLITIDPSQTNERAKAVFDDMDISMATRADYQARVGLFLEYVKQSDGLNRNTFLEYKRWLSARTDLAVATKQKYLATSRIWLKELNRQGVLPADITMNIKGFSQGSKHKRDGLNEAEVERLASRLRELPTTPDNTRLRAILSLLTLQGLRQIELVRLNVKDVELGRSVAYVQGKGRDDTEPVYLHPETVKAIRQYLKTNHIADGPLFTSRSHNSLNQRLTTRSVRNLVQECFAELSIEKTTHGLRHFYTTKLIRAYQGDLLQVAQYTRHRSLEMLQVYFDGVRQEEDLPRYYKTFEGVRF
jgi:site-specific recombinase XerD